MPKRIRYKKAKIKKTNKKYSQYTSDNRYITAFYNKNKTYIEVNIDSDWLAKQGNDSKKAFKKLVEERMKYDKPGLGRKYNAKEAIKAVMGSKEMNPTWTAKDVYASNFVQKIKGDKDLKTAIMNEMDEEKLIKYSYVRKNKKKKEEETIVEVTKLREGFKKEKVKFAGYYEAYGSNATVYTYDEDIYIIEFKSPKKGTGATFQVMSKWDFENEEQSGMISFQKYRKRS